MPYRELLWYFLFFHVPNKSLHSYYRPYLDFVSQLTLYQNKKLRQKAYLFYLIVFAFFAHNLYLWYSKPSAIQCILHVDLAMVAFHTPLFYPCICAFVLQTLYIYKELFMNMNVSYLSLLEDIFFRKRYNKLIEGLTYGTLPPRQATQRKLQLLLNILEFTILCLDTFDLFTLLQFSIQAVTYAGELFGNPLDSPLTFLGNLLFMLSNFTITAIVVTMFAYTMHMGALPGLSFFLLLNWRFKYSESILAVYRKERHFFPLTAFNQYLTYSKATFKSIFTVNKTMGSVMTIVFAVSMPVSAFMLMKLALEEHSLTSTIIMACVPAYQVPIVFGIHLVAAKLAHRLHAPSKVLLSLNAATAHRMGDFRARLRLHTSIVRLHSKAKYGLTYGQIGGKVTMGSFSKCMLLYVEMFLYAYTFIRQIKHI